MPCRCKHEDAQHYSGNGVSLKMWFCWLLSVCGWHQCTTFAFQFAPPPFCSQWFMSQLSLLLESMMETYFCGGWGRTKSAVNNTYTLCSEHTAHVILSNQGLIHCVQSVHRERVSRWAPYSSRWVGAPVCVRLAGRFVYLTNFKRSTLNYTVVDVIVDTRA